MNPGARQVTRRFAYRGRSVGRGSGTLVSAGDARVKVKLSEKGKKALRRARRAKAKLTISLKDATGKVTTATRTVTLKRWQRP